MARTLLAGARCCTLKSMRLPRKGILIRIVIYGGLLSYFGWQAINHYMDEKEAEEGAAAEVDSSGVPSRQYKLPDGRSVEVLEITPEQAEQMYGVSPSVMPGEPEEGSSAPKPPAAEEAGGAAPEGEAPAKPPGSAEEKAVDAPEAAPGADPAPAD